MNKRNIILVCILCALILLFTGCGTDVTPTKAANAEPESETEAAAPTEAPAPKESETFKIGDVVEIGDINVTVNGVREAKGSEFLKPEEGNIYYIVDLTVENIGTEAYACSTMMQMKLADSDGYNYNITFGPETKGSLDGEIGAGRKNRGEVVFEIPKASTGLEFIFDYDIIGTGQAIFKLDR